MKSITVRATKVFAKELTKGLKGNYCIESVELVKIPRDRAFLTVGGGYSDIDIDWADNTVKVLQVKYKPACNAMPKYVTTGELGRLSRGIEPFENYVEAFKNAYFNIRRKRKWLLTKWKLLEKNRFVLIV